MTARERYLTEPVTAHCDACDEITTATQAELNRSGWMWYSSERGEYAVCPACMKAKAEQAEIEREKETKEDYRGFGYGT